MQRSVVQTGPDAPTLQVIPPGEPLAELRAVSKSFGQADSLYSVSLTVYAGEVVALLGPPGAGKTTALNILLGQRFPDTGEAQLLGSDPWFPSSRQGVGITLQQTDFPSTLRVDEIIDLVRAHYLTSRSDDALLRQFGLNGLQRQRAGRLSYAQRRRLAVALALVGEPRLVLLDEPTAGLDAESCSIVWKALRGYVDQSGTVLLATQSLDEVEAVATRVVLLDHGQVVASDSAAAIVARLRLKQVRLKSQIPPSLTGVVETTQDGAWYRIYTVDADSVVRSLVQQGIAFETLEVAPVSLQEALLITSGGRP